MHSSKIIRSTMLAALLTVGAQGVAVAEPSALSPSKIAIFTSAPTTLVQAIKIVEKKDGGTVFRIDAKSDNGSVYYAISSINDGKMYFTTLDPANGRILHSKSRNLIERLFKREEDGEMSSRLKALHTDLVKAIQKAERQDGGQAIDARIKSQDSASITIQVDIVKNGTVKNVFVDGVTNNIVTAAVVQKTQQGDGEDN